MYELIDLVRTQRRDDLAAFLCWLGVRVIEMRRVLKPTGSLYLHCDPTASHYIKALLDGVFGHRNFRNEIVWEYGLGGSSPKLYSKKHDTLFFYTKTKNYHFDKPQIEATSVRMKGQKKGATDVWSIPSINNMAKERTGYPTQKPVALYKRIIAASSNEGDVVLDPFCGCATTLAAAETLNRDWIGIDLWEHAAETLQQRIGFPVHARREPPVRTDDEADVGAHLPSINRRRRRAEPWMRLSHADMRIYSMPPRMAFAPVVGVNCISDLCNSIICNRALKAAQTRSTTA